MDVARDLLARQGTEFLPAPGARLIQLADDREVPQLERGVRRRSGGEDGEVPGDVLTGWDARRVHVLSATAPESARDEGHHCLPSSLVVTTGLLFLHACEAGVCVGV